MLPVLGMIVAGVVATSAEDHVRNKRQERVAERMMLAEEKYPEGGVSFFHFVLEPFPRSWWAGKMWYEVECAINGFAVTRVCPTVERLFYVSGGVPHQMRWDQVEEFDFSA